MFTRYHQNSGHAPLSAILSHPTPLPPLTPSLLSLSANQPSSLGQCRPQEIPPNPWPNFPPHRQTLPHPSPPRYALHLTLPPLAHPEITGPGAIRAIVEVWDQGQPFGQQPTQFISQRFQVRLSISNHDPGDICQWSPNFFTAIRQKSLYINKF